MARASEHSLINSVNTTVVSAPLDNLTSWTLSLGHVLKRDLDEVDSELHNNVGKMSTGAIIVTMAVPALVAIIFVVLLVKFTIRRFMILQEPREPLTTTREDRDVMEGEAYR